MPKRRTDDVVHVVMTDHYIQRRKPSRDLLAPLAEKHDEYKGEVPLLHPTTMSSRADSELYTAVAQVKQILFGTIDLRTLAIGAIGIGLPAMAAFMLGVRRLRGQFAVN